jgi:hypothetical protein
VKTGAAWRNGWASQPTTFSPPTRSIRRT